MRSGEAFEGRAGVRRQKSGKPSHAQTQPYILQHTVCTGTWQFGKCDTYSQYYKSTLLCRCAIDRQAWVCRIRAAPRVCSARCSIIAQELRWDAIWVRVIQRYNITVRTLAGARAWGDDRDFTSVPIGYHDSGTRKACCRSVDISGPRYLTTRVNAKMNPEMKRLYYRSSTQRHSIRCTTVWYL